jgi:hypothetical protein
MPLGRHFAAATAAAVSLVWFMPTASVAQTTGLEDLIGARAGQAESELARRGYQNVRGEQGVDRTYTYWWNADRRRCVTIATVKGRYDSITPTTAPDCRQSPTTRPRPDQSASRPRPGYEPDNRPDYPGSGPVVDGRPVDLGLVCFGDGSRNGIGSGTTWTWNSQRERYEYGTYMQSTTERFDASLMVQLWSAGGRVRLPKTLIPPINSRGDNGWWDLYDVSVGPDLITASYRLNGLNKPRLRIDRRSGQITVQGTASYGFRGTCDTIGNTPRRF